jgi:hypothetical protein
VEKLKTHLFFEGWDWKHVAVKRIWPNWIQDSQDTADGGELAGDLDRSWAWAAATC